MARRRSSGSISATRPIFPSYLLPSLGFSFRRFGRLSVSSSSTGSPAESPITTPSTSPPEHDKYHAGADATQKQWPGLDRSAPDTLRCITCSTDLALASQIISKGFTGRYGRAYLVAPPSPYAGDLLNIRIGRNEDRQLVTGWHVVADICCGTCSRKLGWKYVDAKEESQSYKIGKYILETERVMTHRAWEDAAPDSELKQMGSLRRASTGSHASDTDGIEFDSEDDDECEDIFAGVWNAKTVAKRRSESTARRVSMQ